MEYWVYILYSPSTDTFYKGQTEDLEKRILRHNDGIEKATCAGCPWVLVWRTMKNSRSDAMVLELKLKNLSRKRLISLMFRYVDDIAGPDALLLLKQWQV